jgi:hypothetical protein
VTQVGVVLATGASLLPSPATIALKVRHLPVAAINDAYLLAPWAQALVANDVAWWSAHPEAKSFAGDKWCGNGTPSGVNRMPRSPGIFTNTNSGLLGLHYWVMRGATLIILLGIDLRGTHYFGRHERGLGNPDENRFVMFRQQFADYAKRIPRGVRVVNCSLDSALTVFPKLTLDAALGEAAALTEMAA